MAAMPPSKREPEYREGPDAARATESLLQRVLAVPKRELERREAQYQNEKKSRPTASRRKR
jgi:hypothetical protein